LLRGLTSNAAFSYVTIFLLQLKIMWGAWYLRDMTTGDTTYYFLNAYDWFTKGQAPILWSPLYTSFFGALLYLSQDASLVTMLHRLLIVFGLAILVLALMRRLLPAGIAWCMTAWWVGLPINFDALYEVHLFAVIPILIAALATLALRGPWRLGAAISVLLVASCLMRNELALATVMMVAAVGSARYWRSKHEGVELWPPRATVAAYLVPLVLACGLIGLYYQHASDANSFREVLDRKHRLNICQTYTYGYQQRHSDFTKSAWIECQELMVRQFGSPEPTLTEALRKNPAAMLEHFWWNFSLIPSGIQVTLFNASSGAISPDYGDVTVLPARTIAVSLFVLSLGGWGGFLLWKRRTGWWTDWLRERAWAWVVLGAVASVTLIVMITQRPRPSYMFALAILLRAAVGMCICAIIAKTYWHKLFDTMLPIGIAVLLLIVPSYYEWRNRMQPSFRTRGLYAAYQRLLPFQKMMEDRRDFKILSPGFNGELCNYLAKKPCAGLHYPEVRGPATEPGSSWVKLLDQRGANVIYADEWMLSEPEGQRLVEEVLAASWQQVARVDGGGNKWTLLVRPN
jgi:hypothetical protein